MFPDFVNNYAYQRSLIRRRKEGQALFAAYRALSGPFRGLMASGALTCVDLAEGDEFARQVSEAIKVGRFGASSDAWFEVDRSAAFELVNAAFESQVSCFLLFIDMAPRLVFQLDGTLSPELLDDFLTHAANGLTIVNFCGQVPQPPLAMIEKEVAEDGGCLKCDVQVRRPA